MATLGGAWGATALEERFEFFERAIYGVQQKQDESNDSYLSRHDICFEELLSQNVSLEEVRAYILVRQSLLPAEDKKHIVVEQGGALVYDKVRSAMRLLGSRFFGELQGASGRSVAKTKVYDIHVTDEAPTDDVERPPMANALVVGVEDNDIELEAEYVDAMVMAEDPDAMMVQGFEDELEQWFQDTPELQEALITYLDARSKLLAKRRGRGFWPAQASTTGAKGSKKGGRFSGKRKGRGKGGRESLPARTARSTCRLCGQRGHWKDGGHHNGCSGPARGSDPRF